MAEEQPAFEKKSLFRGVTNPSNTNTTALSTEANSVEGMSTFRFDDSRLPTQTMVTEHALAESSSSISSHKQKDRLDVLLEEADSTNEI